jgi:2-polyprenyl-6-methoxyphenol hydroxylase-like FAD-dependent oxidoreductase
LRRSEGLGAIPWSFAVRIAINRAGIAGPTRAYWLLESGHDVLLVEESATSPD